MDDKNITMFVVRHTFLRIYDAFRTIILLLRRNPRAKRMETAEQTEAIPILLRSRFTYRQLHSQKYGRRLRGFCFFRVFCGLFHIRVHSCLFVV